jgi:xylulokinase
MSVHAAPDASHDAVYLGIDLGTSGVKAVLVSAPAASGMDEIADQANAPLDVSRPRPLWSEQDPEAWWQATRRAIAELRERSPGAMAAVRGIGLSGQMHGATLLDDADRVLRPAILWNDGRSAEACRELERRVPTVRKITGNLVMPGFTAPKLLWVAEHEPEIAARVERVLLPKDWLRLRLTGEHASEMSDASGTGWLDVASRAWSSELVEACGLSVGAMPRLYEGSEATGELLPELAREWGLADGVVVAGGAGDQAAGAAGAGIVRPGEGFLALGTSGVYFVAGDRFAPNPDRAVHAFCHCLPGRWHQMSVILSAASCLTWVSRLVGARDEAAALERASLAISEGFSDAVPIFLPYLSGERTPHNDPEARGVFFGLTHDSGPGELVASVLEGVAHALADGQDALLAAGAPIASVALIGGGARSDLWGRVLAAALDRPLNRIAGAEVGPALGAARLGRLAVTGEAPEAVCTLPRVDREVEVDSSLRDVLARRRETFRRLYPTLQSLPHAGDLAARETETPE